MAELADYRTAELLGGDPDVWDPVTDDYEDPGVEMLHGDCLMGHDSHE